MSDVYTNYRRKASLDAELAGHKKAIELSGVPYEEIGIDRTSQHIDDALAEVRFELSDKGKSSVAVNSFRDGTFDEQEIIDLANQRKWHLAFDKDARRKFNETVDDYSLLAPSVSGLHVYPILSPTNTASFIPYFTIVSALTGGCITGAYYSEGTLIGAGVGIILGVLGVRRANAQDAQTLENAISELQELKKGYKK